jgi:hypothetical protein
VFPAEERKGTLRLVASPDGRDGSLSINQDVGVHATLLDAGQEAVHRLAPGRHAWIQVARGALEANGQRLEAGDGAAVSGEDAVRLKGGSAAEALVFDLS